MRPIGLSAFIVLAVCLTGCGHNFYMVGRTTGAVGQARITSTPGHPGGDIALTIAGKVYNGRWVYMEGGGTVGLGTATAFPGGKSATATHSFIGLPTGGNGSVLAAAADGSQIRCVFDYSEMNNTGVGTCEDSKGELYDLQIN